MSTEVASKAPGQLRGLLRAAHPRQAVAFALGVGLLVALMGRPGREVLVGAVAVLLAQLAMGLVNDLCDVRRDQRSEAQDKPVAEGLVPSGNASFAVAVLLLLVLPLSLQNGIAAGLFLLATLVVGLVHNRFLHTTTLSFVGWAATFALLTYFVTLGGWGGEADGPRDEGNVGAKCGERFGDGETLLARRAVGDHPHRVDRFVGRPGGDDDVLAREPLILPGTGRGTSRRLVEGWARARTLRKPLHRASRGPPPRTGED